MTNLSSFPDFIHRKAKSRLDDALADTRVVLVVGPRQAGKTTLVRSYATPDKPYVTLDDPQSLATARLDPVGFMRGLPAAIIDEIQRVPELLLAIKESVDRDPKPGRFLLTGSANVMSLPTIADSLAGRVATTLLLPFAQTEIEGSPGTFIDRIFAGELPSTSAVSHDQLLLQRVLNGGYPEALRRKTDLRRGAWHEDYLALILDRDVRDIARIEQLDRLPKLVRMLGEHAGQLLNVLSLASPLGLSSPTIHRYITILERLFLVRVLPPWHSNKLSRLIKTPKLHFLDSGLLANIRGDTVASLQEDRTRFGQLLETFAFAEILKLASWSNTRVTVSHFRTKEMDEVDLVLEDNRGRIVGIEIKAGATLRPKDFSGLRKLQEATGDRFLRGLILHDHDRVTPFNEKIHSAPVSVLWTM
jgi:uncharacterized protein